MSFLQSIVSWKNKLSRNVRSSNIKRGSSTSREELKSKLNGWSSVLIKFSLALLTTFAIGYYILVPYSQLIFVDIQEHPSTIGKEKPKWNMREKTTILLIGTDEYADGYTFIDNLTLIVHDARQASLGYFGINVDIDTYSSELKKTVNLRSLFNDTQTKGKEIEILRGAVENLLALRINRYILIEKKDFIKFATNLNDINLELSEDVIDEDITAVSGDLKWNKGKAQIDSSSIGYFVTSDVRGKQAQMQRQLALLQEISKTTFSWKNIINITKVGKSFAHYAKTDITKPELMRLVLAVRSVKENAYKSAFIRDASLFYKESVGIYSRYTADTAAIDEDISAILINPDLLEEQARIEIFNASGVTGLARSRERWLTNQGARVIQAGNNPEEFERTVIYVKDKSKYSATLKEIENIFNGRITYSDTEYKYRSVGDIVIVIGKEYQ